MHTIPFVLLFLVATAAPAQEIESLAGVRFTFISPGARSLGMGGTSVTSADPAAASVNPAAIAAGPHAFSAEVRRSETEARYYGDPALNTVGLRSTTNGIGSVFVTVPLDRGAWSFGYDEPLNVSHATVPLFTSGAFTGAPFSVCNARVSETPCAAPDLYLPQPATYPITTSLSLRRYSTSAAWSAGPLAFGASARYENFRQETAFADMAPAISSAAESTDDGAWTYAAGATWQVIPNARMGASYASGGRFDGQRTFPGTTSAAQNIEFRTPSVLRVGGEIAVTPQLTLAAEAVHVAYSEMMKAKRHTFPQGSALGMPDVTEPHVGAEYRSGNFAVRGGWWRDPAHALQITNGVLPPMPLSAIAAVVSEAENHATAGISIGKAPRFDAAVDRGSRSTRIAVGVGATF